MFVQFLLPWFLTLLWMQLKIRIDLIVERLLDDDLMHYIINQTWSTCFCMQQQQQQQQ